MQVFVAPLSGTLGRGRHAVGPASCSLHGQHVVHHKKRPRVQTPTSVRLHIHCSATSAPGATPASESDENTDTPKKPRETLFLVDAMNFVFRGHYALQNASLSGPRLKDTRAVYGFTISLLSFIANHARDAPVAVVFEGTSLLDAGETDFRTEIYAEYKATRPATPEGVRMAVPWAKDIVRALGCAVVEVKGVEGDDVIGTLVRRAREERDMDCVILSSDKDFRQLLNGGEPEVRILKPQSSPGKSGSYTYVTEEDFRAEFGDIPPRRFVDVLALLGDKADNIPGVPSIGGKSAPKLVEEFGTIEDLLGVVESAVQASGGTGPVKAPGLKPGQVKALRANGEEARMSKLLATIREDVSMPHFDWKQIQRRPVDVRLVDEVAAALDFQRLRPRMLDIGNGLRAERGVDSGLGEGAADSASTRASSRLHEADTRSPDTLPLGGIQSVAETPEIAYQNISEKTGDELQRVVRDLEECSRERGAIGIAVIADQGNVLSGIALCASPGIAYYLDTTPGALHPSLKRILSDENVEKRGWDMKKTCKVVGNSLCGQLFDVRIACDLIYAGQNLTDEFFADRYLGTGVLASTGAVVDDVKRVGPCSKPCVAMGMADTAFRLGHATVDDLETFGVSDTARRIEFPLIPVLADMEKTGLPFDGELLDGVWRRVEDSVQEVKERVMALVPDDLNRGDGDIDAQGASAKKLKTREEFSVTSRDDVANLLYDTWGVPVKKKTATGKGTTNKQTLTAIARDSSLAEKPREFAKLMLQHRELSKLSSSYTKTLAKSISTEGRVHATFVQEASASGRLSTSNPNLQAIPSRSVLGREIRAAVAPQPGRSLVCADYSQIELRILAALSGDAAMCDAFQSGSDIHTAVAARISGVDEADVTPDQRSKAKAVSFGIPYGISSYGLSQQLSISTAAARALISDFYEAYPDVKGLTEDLVERAFYRGYAETLGGRRLYLPGLRGGRNSDRRAAERVAMNMPIQGTQADMIKLAMTAIWRELKHLDSGLVLQVHDELVIETRDEDVGFVEQIVCEEMCRALPLPHGVEVVVKCGVADNWLAAAEVSSIWNGSLSDALQIDGSDRLSLATSY